MYYDYRDGCFRYRTKAKPILHTYTFWIMVIGILSFARPLFFGAGKLTVIQSQLGIITEQECVEKLSKDLSPGHAIPCGSLIRIMGEAIGGVETEHTRKMARDRQTSWERVQAARAKRR